MGLSYKNKRKIIVDEKIYYWYVKWDEDWFLENIIYILDNKMHHVFCYVVGKNETRVFGKLVSSPVWISSNNKYNNESVYPITSAIIAKIIKWSTRKYKSEL